MYEHITKAYIRIHRFSGDGLTFPNEARQPRLSVDTVQNLLPEKACIQLRKRLVGLVIERYDNRYALLEVECGINSDTFRKYANGKRRVTRDALAKLCVGMRLPMETAQELFRLEGHSLEPEINLLDAIVCNALNEGDDIATFYETCRSCKLNIS